MKVSYRALEERDIPAAIELWKDRMAEGYPDRLLLQNSADGVEGYVASVAVSDGDIVGFAGGHVGTFANIVAVPYEHIEPSCEWAPLKQVGYFAILCVKKAYESRGIGTKLASNLLSVLSQYQPQVMTQVWHRTTQDGGDVVESLGFEPVYTSSEYWRYATAGYDECPECNSSPCECTGTLFVRDTSKEDTTNDDESS